MQSGCWLRVPILLKSRWARPRSLHSITNQQTFMGGYHIPCNVPGTYRDHLEKSLLSWDQWTWVLKETDLELMI